MTKKAELQNLKDKEKRISRIKDSKNFILANKLSGLLNNYKWYQVFELIENNHLEFYYKILLDSKVIKSKQLLELEKSSFISDSSTGFIEFLEVDFITFNSSFEVMYELTELNIQFTVSIDKIIINGYR